MNTIDNHEVTIDTTPALVPDPDNAAQLLARIEPELAAVKPDETLRVLTDIPRAARIAIGAAGKLRVLRPRILAELPTVPIKAVDDLETYAIVAWYTHNVTLPASSSDNPVHTLLDEAVILRGELLTICEMFAYFGYISPDKIAEVKAGKGFLDTANDLVALGGICLGLWDRIEGRSPMTREQVARAIVLGTKLLKALGGDGASASTGAERRVRAYTLFVNAYEQCRRAVTFLGWFEGEDVEAIVPSLFSKPRRRPADGAPSEQPSPPAVDAPPPPVTTSPAAFEPS